MEVVCDEDYNPCNEENNAERCSNYCDCDDCCIYESDFKKHCRPIREDSSFTCHMRNGRECRDQTMTIKEWQDHCPQFASKTSKKKKGKSAKGRNWRVSLIPAGRGGPVATARRPPDRRAEVLRNLPDSEGGSKSRKRGRKSRKRGRKSRKRGRKSRKRGRKSRKRGRKSRRR